MNRIVFESDTPHGVMALMLVNAAPHLRGSTALTPAAAFQHGVNVANRNLGDTTARTTDPVVERPLGELQQAGGPAPVDTSNQAQVAEAVEAVRPVRKPRGKKADTPATTDVSTVVNVEGPDGQTRNYETIGEALEGMADMLDLCDSADEVTAWVAKHKGLLDGAGHPGEVFRKMAEEVKAEKSGGTVATAAPAEPDPLPVGDTVGAKPKPVENPPEMSLDTLEPPAFLKRTAPKPEADVPQPTEKDARDAFLAYCEARGAPAGRKLLDKYEAPKVSALKVEQRPNFIVECKAGVPV